MRLRVLLSALLLLLLLPGVAAARYSDERGKEYASQIPADEILLKDGNLIRGKIVEIDEERLVFDTSSLGRLVIDREQIERISYGTSATGVRTDPDCNSIMFCPTPATLPRGSWYFRDFELFILNFGYAVTECLDISFGTLFPISSSLIMGSVGGKYCLLDRERYPCGLAVAGNYTALEDLDFGALGAIVGIGDSRRSLNFSLNRSWDDDGDSDTIFLIGGDYCLTRSTKFFAEYGNSQSLLENEDNDLHGFLNIGLRIFRERMSFSLSGFRPLAEDSGSFIAFPMAMFSVHW